MTSAQTMAVASACLSTWMIAARGDSSMKTVPAAPIAISFRAHPSDGDDMREKAHGRGEKADREQR
jgi:hypothetical protein